MQTPSLPGPRRSPGPPGARPGGTERAPLRCLLPRRFDDRRVEHLRPLGLV